MSLDFTGGNSDVVNHGSGASLDDLQTWTVLMLINIDSFSGAGYPMRKGRSGNEDRQIQYFNTDGHFTGLVRRSGANDSTGPVATSITVAAGWGWLAVTYDAAGTSGQRLNMYSALLGQALTFDGQGGTGSGTVADASQDLKVGGDGANSINGQIACFFKWSRVLSLAEINVQAGNPSWPYDSANLVLWAHYGLHGTGTQPDLSGNRNNGTVTGAAFIAHPPISHPFARAFPSAPSQAAAGATLTASPSDGLSFGDTPAPAATLRPAASDGLTLGSTPSPAATFAAALADGVTAGDTATIAKLLQAALSDGLIGADTASPLATFRPAASDGLVLSDTPAVSATLAGSAVDGLTLSEALSVAALLAAAASDGATFGDTAAGTLSGAILAAATDGLALGDTASPAAQFVATVADGLNVGETLAAVATLLAAAADGVDLGDTAAGTVVAAVLAATATDGLVLGDTGQTTATFVVSTADGVQFAETLAAVMTLAAAAADGLEMADVAVHILAAGLVSVTFTVKQASVTFVVRAPGVDFEGKQPGVSFDGSA